MSIERKTCPIMSRETIRDCRESGCMAWREINHNDWDCVLLRNNK